MENIFCQDNHISDTALLDNLVHFATLKASERYRNCRITFGEIKEFTLCFLPKIGERCETSGEIVYKRGRNLLVQTRISVDGETAAKCKVKFYKEEKNEDTGNIL